ncbi:MAG: hypothetical protein A2Y65_06645 [Deltaproteobacteria bacterium RBG_13_52_11]|nr:MAG: hypothetical protein A2Y65_06645 [Deltaproteobacteria bacterium RBG_13_52_11]
MGREIKGFIIGALVSGGIHLAIFFVPISRTPTLLHVQEIPGSIEVSLGAHQEALGKSPSTKTIETKSSQREIEAQGREPSPTFEARAKAQGAEDDTPGGKNPDQRGNSPLAIPRYEGNAKPPYPEIARRRGYEGTVRLTVEVLASGQVGGVKVKGSSGYEVLDRSALKAVKEWSFIPAQFGGVPVKSMVIVPITFQLRDQLAAENR